MSSVGVQFQVWFNRLSCVFAALPAVISQDKTHSVCLLGQIKLIRSGNSHISHYERNYSRTFNQRQSWTSDSFLSLLFFPRKWLHLSLRLCVPFRDTHHRFWLYNYKELHPQRQKIQSSFFLHILQPATLDIWNPSWMWFRCETVLLSCCCAGWWIVPRDVFASFERKLAAKCWQNFSVFTWAWSNQCSCTTSQIWEKYITGISYRYSLISWVS